MVGRDHLGPFVGLALLVVTAMVWWRYRRIAAQQGIQARLWPWLGVASAALVGGVATSRGGTALHWAWLNVAGPFIVNALALLALSALLRSRVLGLAVASMLVTSTVVPAVMSGDSAVATQLGAYAAVLLAASARIDA